MYFCFFLTLSGLLAAIKEETIAYKQKTVTKKKLIFHNINMSGLSLDDLEPVVESLSLDELKLIPNLVKDY